MSRTEGAPDHVATLELLEGPPATVEAGATVRFCVRAVCPMGCDLAAAPLVVEGAGAEDVELVATRAEGSGAETRIALRAPAALGPAWWTVRLAEDYAVESPHAGRPLRIAADVVPHRTSLAVWDVPSPRVGSLFTVRVGVECSAGCPLGGLRVRVCADSGESLGEGTLEGTPRPDSRGLYEATVPLEAPAATGVHIRRVRFEGEALELPHDGAEATFSFRALATPECNVTVRVTPEGLAAPLDGIDVRLGPYRTETDEHGVARVEATRGPHELSLWRIDIEPVSLPVTVSGDADLTLAVAPRRRVDADEGREWM